MSAPYRLFPVEVRDLVRLSPSFLRVTFTGTDLAAFADNGRDQRIKLMLPAPAGGFGDLADSPDWYGSWRALPARRQPPLRTYTIRAVRTDRREVDVDMVLHPDGGPAARWAGAPVAATRSCWSGRTPGSTATTAARCSGRTGPTRRCCWPATRPRCRRSPRSWPGCRRTPVARRCSRCRTGRTRSRSTHPPAWRSPGCPAGVPRPARCSFRLTGAAGRLTPQSDVDAAARPPAGADVDADVDVDVDVDAGILREVPDAATGAPPLYAWLAGEAGVIRLLRRRLLTDHGLDRRAVAFMGYWRIGRAEPT